MKTREAVSPALETQAVISKPRPNPEIRRFLTTVHKEQGPAAGALREPFGLR
jgi:hypothetical protein